MASVIADWLAVRYPEVGCRDFYRFLFPDGEFEQRGEQVDGSYNGIAVQIGSSGVKRFIVTDDHRVIDSMVASDDFCVMSPVSYAGKSQRQSMSRYLYAVVFDLDGLRVRGDSPVGLIDFLHQTTLDNAYAVPKPTFIVASGTGVHLYYVLEDSIPLFENVIAQLGRLRRDLCKKIWNSAVTDLSQNIQFESVTQGFRMVGSMAKDGKTRVRAFRTGDRVSIEYLNGFCTDEGDKVTTLLRKGKMNLEEAKEKYPDWYRRRVVEGQKPGSWLAKRDLYDWWKRKIEEGAVDGHRYFCIMALAVFARKSECRLRTKDERAEEKRTGKKLVLPPVSQEDLESDAYGFIDMLNARSVDPERNPFTAEDVAKALEAYTADYQTFPRESLEALTNIPMPANKRNGRSREAHMTYLNGMNAVRRSMGESLGAGRPNKERLVLEYAASHPNKSNREIADDLGISRNTVNKWRKLSS